MTDSEEVGNVASELQASIETILRMLVAVGNGDLSQRLAQEYPDTHPAGALVQSVNYMTQALAEARDQSSAYLHELQSRLSTIERQREAIRNLSVPIIEIWVGVLCAPVVGVLDTVRAAEVTTTLLEAVVVKKARHVIIDVTGVEVMDTKSADHFLRIARAVTLLGAECAMTGMHPDIARTIVHMGVELDGIKSYRNMRDALKACVKERRARPVRKEDT